MISLYIELAEAEIMANKLSMHANGYHLDIAGPSLTIQMRP